MKITQTISFSFIFLLCKTQDAPTCADGAQQAVGKFKKKSFVFLVFWI